MAILDSQFAFWFWLLYGDSFHVTKAILSHLPIGVSRFSSAARDNLVKLGRELQSEMSRHIIYNKMQGRIVANYDLLACRPITNEIDQLLVSELDLGNDFLSDLDQFCKAAAGLNV